MKKITLFTLFIAVLGLGAFASPAFPTANDNKHNVGVKKRFAAVPFHYDYTQTYSTRFFDNCSGEWVDLTETLTYSVHGVVNNNKINFDTHIVVRESGEGETSGNNYTGNFQTHSHFNDNFNGAFTENESQSGVLATAGGGNNIKLTLRFKVTVNAKGDVTVLRGDSSYDCQ